LAVLESSCDWLLALDADDALEPGALDAMWEVKDPDRYVYGDVQVVGGSLVKLPDWTVNGAFSHSGTIPVTALHHRSLWEAVNGWPEQFAHGLEDVAYWAAATARGFTGFHMNRVTLRYRKHDGGRTARMRANGTRDRMRDLLHHEFEQARRDLWERRAEAQAPIQRQPKKLVGNAVWVRCNTGAAFGHEVHGMETGEKYWCPGHGSRFQVWAQDADWFRKAQRGRGYVVET
jgi:hypothetical protein